MPRWWVLAIVLGWVAAVHASGSYGVFVADDHSLTENDALLRFFDFDWFRLSKRPLTTATFAANFSLFGPGPFACHVVNLLIHVTGVAVLFLLVERTLALIDTPLSPEQRTYAAGCVGLLWGVHPITTSAVTYIVQRAESLASLGILGCLFAWSMAFGPPPVTAEADPQQGKRLRRAGRMWAVLALTGACVAYGSKEMAAGLPLIVLLYDRIFLARSWRVLGGRLGWYALLAFPLVFGVWVMWSRLTASSRSTIGFNLEGFSAWSYFVSQPAVFAQYIKLSFVPIHQALDYGWLPPQDTFGRWAGMAGWIVVIAGLVAAFRRSKPLGWLISSMLLILAPTSTILPLQDIIFEHRFYLPSAGLIAAVVIGIAVAVGRRNRESAALIRRLVLPALLVAAVFSWLVMQRNLDYTSAARLHETDLRLHPENPRVWYSVAMTASFERPEPKIRMLKRAIELAEQREYFYAGTEYSWARDLADTMFVSGQFEDSRPYYRQALEHAYDELHRTEILFRLAMIASLLGDQDRADELFVQSLQGDPLIRAEIEAAYLAHQSRLDSHHAPGQPAGPANQ